MGSASAEQPGASRTRDRHGSCSPLPTHIPGAGTGSAAGIAPGHRSRFSCRTCEPQERVAFSVAVSDLLYPSHQSIHLAQGGSVDAPARGGGWQRGYPQRDVHMGQRQVEEKGVSAVAAQGRGGARLAGSTKGKVEAGGHRGGGTAKPGDTDRWPFLPGALQPLLPPPQLPGEGWGGKTALRSSAGCKPCKPLPLPGRCLVQRDPLLPCSWLKPLLVVHCPSIWDALPPSPGVPRASRQPNAPRRRTPGTHPPPSSLSRGPFWPFLPLPSKRLTPDGDF